MLPGAAKRGKTSPMTFALVLQQLTPGETGKLQGSERIRAAGADSFARPADFLGLGNVLLVLELLTWSIAPKHAL